MTGTANGTQHPLTYIRGERGWSLREVAELVQRGSGLNMATWRQKVYRWERGVVPEMTAQYALADALGVDQTAVDAIGWPGWLHLATATTPADDGEWTIENARKVLAALVESGSTDRRGFLIYGGSALSSIAAGWADTPPEPIADGLDGGRVGTNAIAGLQLRVAELWRLDDTLGGGSCLQAAAADLRMVDALLRQARHTGPVGRELLSTAASLARFAGWAAFDCGHLAAAQRYWHGALRAAHAAHDTVQGIYILSNLALQAIYAGDGRTAVDLLEAARAQLDPAHRIVAAMLDAWQVRAHAILGEQRQASQLLNRADDLWANRRDGDDPDWVYWMPQPSLTAEAGTAMINLRQLSHADELLHAGLATLSPAATRDRNLYLVRIAETSLSAGRLDEAMASARAAIDAAAGVDSSRVTQRLTGLLDQLPADEPGTAEVREYWRAARQVTA
ncbi:helix-turn-helix domain-containing protein [Longispora fulva]|nr:helix-turn-helix transcriptional regulator [Longispora fulva]MBG6134187.1 transcriptional regulator with XRE-family HTH domain [Longispora fulva]